MSSANYAACLKVILQNEGGYVNNPKDPGGETNYGITKATAAANGYTGSMRTIPMSVVESIYRKKFWTTAQFKGDNLTPGVDLVWFDYCVNSGPGRANAALAAVLGGSASDTIDRLCDARLRFLKGLGTWPTFGKGWATRVEKVRKLAKQMAVAAPVAAPPVPTPAPKAPDAPAPIPAKPAPSPQPAPQAPVTIWTSIGNLLSAFFAAISKK